MEASDRSSDPCVRHAAIDAHLVYVQVAAGSEASVAALNARHLRAWDETAIVLEDDGVASGLRGPTLDASLRLLWRRVFAPTRRRSLGTHGRDDLPGLRAAQVPRLT